MLSVFQFRQRTRICIRRTFRPRLFEHLSLEEVVP